MATVSCRLCSTSSLEFMYKAKGYDICRCKNCNLAQISKNPSNEELNKIYSKTFFSKGKFSNDMAFYLEAKRRMKLINAVSKNKKVSVLDYGCATGDFLHIGSEVFDMYGTDFSKDAITEARVKYPHLSEKFFQIDNKQLYREKFDIVVAWDVIEHSTDPLSTLNEMVVMLKPGGYIILSTPNFDTLSAKIFKEKWAFMIPPEHICFFDKTTLLELFRGYNHSLIDWKSVGKWVNFGFLLYKFRQAFGLIPNVLVTFVQKSFMKKVCFYIPTADIQYMTIMVKGEIV